MLKKRFSLKAGVLFFVSLNVKLERGGGIASARGALIGPPRARLSRLQFLENDNCFFGSAAGFSISGNSSIPGARRLKPRAFHAQTFSFRRRF